MFSYICSKLMTAQAMVRFKYQEYIDKLLSEGYSLPEMHLPEGMEAFRFVHSYATPNNHKPVCIQNPARVLPDNQKLSGYALSCFDGREKAKERYAALCKSFKRAPKTIGDALSGGNLNDSDGWVTKPDNRSGHFDLYESLQCDLTKTFKTIEILWKK